MENLSGADLLNRIIGLNNPYRYTDPDGEFAFLIPIAIFSGEALGGLAGHVVGATVVAGIATWMMNENGEAEEDSKKLKPEAGLLGSKKHGVNWKEGPARAKKTGKEQGQFGSKEDVESAVEEAESLEPGQSDTVDLPEGHTSVVHKADGTKVSASKVWVQRNKSGTVHAYPKE